MIEIRQGNMLQADVDALVNTVNCVGVMGRGIALQFKKTWPANFKAYETACRSQQVRPGKMFVFETGALSNPKFIINFPTKRHWRAQSRLSDIEMGLLDLVKVIKSRRIKSIAIPPLGAGLGGLSWEAVRFRIEQAVRDLPDVQVLIYEPLQQGPSMDCVAQNVPAMTPGRAVLIQLIQQYLKGMLAPFVSLLEVHKLLYFMQEAGEPLRLKYSKYHYGPYADNLRHVLTILEGHYIEGYKDGGDSPNKRLNLKTGASQVAESFLRQYPDTLDRFNRVARLVNGFESPFGMELLATVHWAVQHEKITDLDQLVQFIHRWNAHKKIFSDRQILLAYKVLNEQGWLTELTMKESTTIGLSPETRRAN